VELARIYTSHGTVIVVWKCDITDFNATLFK
jgi:hypothetical protein